MVDWSYDLLSDQERHVLCRLGVFAGDWTLEAAEAVCGGDGIGPSQVLGLLGRMVESRWWSPNRRMRAGKSASVCWKLCVSTRSSGSPRKAAWPTRHAATRATRGVGGESRGRFEAGDEVGALGSVEPEHDNVRAALRHLLVSGEAELAARLSGALAKFWFFRGHLNEGGAALKDVLALAEQAGLPSRPSLGMRRRSTQLRSSIMGAGLRSW